MGQATGRTAWRGTETRRGAGPGLSARPGTCGRSHLSRSEAGGPRGLVAGARGSGSPWPTHHAHDARHHLRLRHEAPQVEGAARVGRAVGPALHVAVAAEPQMAENQPDRPAPFWPWGRGRPPKEGVASRRGLAAGCPSVPAAPCQVAGTWGCACGGAGVGQKGGKAHLWEVSTRKVQRDPWERNSWAAGPHLTPTPGFWSTLEKLSRHPNPIPRLINVQMVSGGREEEDKEFKTSLSHLRSCFKTHKCNRGGGGEECNFKN